MNPNYKEVFQGKTTLFSENMLQKQQWVDIFMTNTTWYMHVAKVAVLPKLAWSFADLVAADVEYFQNLEEKVRSVQ